MPDRKVIAQEFVNLKNRVRNEMRRRNGYGSMVSYADAKYDFKNSALPNTLLRLEYMTQNHIPLRAVSTSQLPENIKLVITESDMAAMEAKITAYESQPREARTHNDCDALCSGMCVTQCTTTCSGSCTGTCSGSCSGSCSGGCSGGCYGGCGGCLSAHAGLRFSATHLPATLPLALCRADHCPGSGRVGRSALVVHPAHGE